MNYSKIISPNNTPQSEPLFGKDQVKNNAGGYVFAIDDFKRLERFLILGSAGGTYYVKEKKLTIDNAECVVRALKENYVRAIDLIVDVSVNGRAPKNDPAVFALAIAACSHDVATSRYAFDQLEKVCRIPTHLFQFVEAINTMRGWWRSARNNVAKWYNNKQIDQLIYQATKYANREGWTHKDVFRLTHIKGSTDKHKDFYQHIIKDDGYDKFPYLKALQDIKTASDKDVVKLINEYNIPRECVPTEKLNNVAVWDALLQKMPLNAMVRNLGKMSSIGLLKPLSKAEKLVVERLNDRDYIRKSRLHPISILMASTVYNAGRGIKGDLTWEKSSMVLDALDKAFYLAFDNVEKLDKKVLIGVDISGSMGSQIAGTFLTCRYASAALSIVLAHQISQYHIMGFYTTFKPLNVTKNSTLAQADQALYSCSFGGTDCALPMIYAQKNNLEVDLFTVLTDSETWYGNVHPCQALKNYRQHSGINAKLAVIGMTATEFSIADPNDLGSMDFVGFSTDTPTVLNNFITS